MISYTKNKQTGYFDIIGPSSEMVEGRTVTVTLASGATKRVTVGKVSKPFEARFGANVGKSVCIAKIMSSGSAVSRNGGNVCAECGRSGALVRDLEDGQLKHYNCCDIAP